LATTGLSRSKEIKEKFADYLGEKFQRRKNPSHVRTDLLRLVNLGLLLQYEVRLERHGQSKGYMYELSEAGLRRAKALNVVCVESEVKQGKRAHDTLEHFYQILDIADVLKSADYKVFLYESAVKFQDDTQYIPDIKAVGPDERSIYIEVERTARGADDLEHKYVRAAVLCDGDLFLGVINKSKARQVGGYALEIKARRSNAIKRIFMLNVGDQENTTLWKKIDHPSDLGLAEDGQNGEN